MRKLIPWVRWTLAAIGIGGVVLTFGYVVGSAGGSLEAQAKASICSSGPAPNEAEARRARDDVFKRPRLTPAQVTAAKAAYAEACLRRWSYRLSGSGEPVAVVADAAVQACGYAFEDLGAEASSTEEPTVRETAAAQARFYAVQAKAGHCRVSGDQ